ncbi:MAG: hypothetical protein EBR87_10955, partial [Cytophagia bacterium]|nr:hypothetical protein [Cytophagia bacterium]
HFALEKAFKISSVEKLRGMKTQIKELKLKINEVEDELVNKEQISIKGLHVLCLVHNVSITYIYGKQYCEFFYGDTVKGIIQRNEKKEHSLLYEDTLLETIKQTHWFIENVQKWVLLDNQLKLVNEKTKNQILHRELDFKPGDSVAINSLEARLEYNRRKLMNTNLFIWVKADLNQLPNGHLKISFEFLEQWYILGYPIFQLADRNLNDWWSRGHDLNRSIYGIHFIHNNFQGRNEKLTIKAETGFTQRLDFTYSNPYLDKKKTLGLSFNTSYSTSKSFPYKTRNDTLQYLTDEKILRERWAGGITLRKRFKFYDFQTLELKYTHTIISDTVVKLNPNYFSLNAKEQNFTQLLYTYSYDFRDLIAYPLRGRKFDISINKVGILPSDHVDFW